MLFWLVYLAIVLKAVVIFEAQALVAYLEVIAALDRILDLQVCFVEAHCCFC